MSGLNWDKQRQRNTMARHGVESLADEKTRDRLRQDANALLAAHPYPKKGKGKVVTRGSRMKAGKRLIGAAREMRSLVVDKAVPAGLVIYADGCCEPNPGPGGWGFVVYRDGVEIYSETGGALQTTNNQMEMTGALKALQWLADRTWGELYGIDPAAVAMSQPRLLCDSRYVVDGCNSWRLGWKRNGWNKRRANSPKRADGEIKNLELWKELDRLLDLTEIKLEWVKGHAGIIGNERADELSLIGREQAIEAAQAADPIRQQLAYVA